MAGRTGGSPMPPAMITMSPPSASSSGQQVPYGPRTATRSPGSRAHSAWVAIPTSRMVCSTGRPAAGSPLIEIGTWPMPNAPSMLNWPGRKANTSPGGGSSSRVTVSCDSRRVAVTRQGAGSVHGRDTAGSASGRMDVPVHVQQPQPGGLQPPDGEAGEQLRQLESQPRVIGAFPAQAGPVQGEGAHRFDGPAVELPLVRLQQPREPRHVTCAQGLHDNRPAARRGDLQRHLSLADQEALTGRLALTEHE